MAVITPGLPHEQLCLDLRAATITACAAAGLPTEVISALECSTNRPTSGHLFFGTAENIAGSDRPYVLVAGFEHPSYLRVRWNADALHKRVDPAAYTAITRCTFQLSIVEVDAAAFGAHLQISASGDAGVTQVEATPGASASQMAMRGQVDWSEIADGSVSNQRSVVTNPRTAEVLDASGRQLTAVPGDVWQLAGLMELNLKSNQLTVLPSDIGQLTNLEELNLMSNKLTSLPVEIGQLARLQKLNLGENNLASLPPDIGRLTKLEELDLWRNRLTALPANIGRLARLEELDVSSNNLASLPPAIGRLVGLTKLVLRCNQLRFLPPEIGQLASLEELDVTDNNLESLPPEMGQLADLEKLNLGSNRLPALPVEIGQLAGLKELNLKSNMLTSLPVEIGQLGNLEELNLNNNNELTVLPAEIEDIQATGTQIFR